MALYIWITLKYELLNNFLVKGAVLIFKNGLGRVAKYRTR